MRNVFVVLIIFLAGLLGTAASAKGISVPFRDGELRLDFLRDDAVRVRYGVPAVSDTLPEWIYGEDTHFCKKCAPHSVTHKSAKDGDRYSTAKLTIYIPKDGTGIQMTDLDGNLLFDSSSMELAKRADGTTSASITWANPEGERLYGLGQFQDGYADVSGLTRRLTQVNTQISIPMLVSTEGYGILWNNYGLTDFNPCADSVRLQKSADGGKVTEVAVTTDHGGATERREENTFTAEIDVDHDGRYAVMLDVGQKMARRHHLFIDGQEIISADNVWLPPTASAIVPLTKGRHQVTASLEKDDNPTLFFRYIDHTSTFSSDEAENVDFTLFAGTADEVVKAQRDATGGCPMMPEWALGYIHCRERFHSQDEILDNASEFRRRGIPMDVMVQDWQYWGPHGWNAMRFDEANYPDPKQLTDSLHAMDSRLMLSVWSKIDKNSEVGREASERGYMLPGTEWIDFFNPEAADFYWSNFSRRLLPLGIDAWWQDATEPENDDLLGRRVMDGRYRGETFRNVYPLLVNRTVYEGLRKDRPGQRNMILTRCGFPGIQRYGAAMWSGDVGHDWKTLSIQIKAGLGMMAAGMPWWTYDAGGFFRPWGQHEDPAYQEVMLRWIQTAAFLPLMRVHGYMSDTEPWRYGEETESRFADAIRTRYRLLPYIYSLSHKVSEEGYTLMRPMAFDYPSDSKALDSELNFMFGPSLYVCPVVEPGLKETEVWLPKVEGGWYELQSGNRHEGGANVKVPVTMENIPVFVKAGSIIPVLDGNPQSSRALHTADIILDIYPGADADFLLYEDDGETYGYERGECSEIPLHWDDASSALTVGARTGAFPGMPAVRNLTVRLRDGSARTLTYTGSPTTVQIPAH